MIESHSRNKADYRKDQKPRLLIRSVFYIASVRHIPLLVSLHKKSENRNEHSRPYNGNISAYSVDIIRQALCHRVHIRKRILSGPDKPEHMTVHKNGFYKNLNTQKNQYRIYESPDNYSSFFLFLQNTRSFAPITRLLRSSQNLCPPPARRLCQPPRLTAV